MMTLSRQAVGMNQLAGVAGLAAAAEGSRAVRTEFTRSSPWRSREMIVPSGPKRMMQGMPEMPYRSVGTDCALIIWGQGRS